MCSTSYGAVWLEKIFLGNTSSRHAFQWLILQYRLLIGTRATNLIANIIARVTRSCDLSQNLRYLTPVCDCSWPATRRSKTCDFWLQNSATLRFLNFIEAIFAIFLFFDQKVMTSVKDHTKIILKLACWCTCSTTNLNVIFPPPSFLLSAQKDMHFYSPHPPHSSPPKKWAITFTNLWIFG